MAVPLTDGGAVFDGASRSIGEPAPTCGGGVGLLDNEAALELTYADTGHAPLVAPVFQVDGRALSERCEESSLRQAPLGTVRRYNAPPVPSSATQYLLPEVTAVEGIVTVFHVPPDGEPFLPDATRVPGWPFLSL
jgi:hypothetical protein